MKKFILLCFILALPAALSAQTTDCPFGFIDDQAPGICARYVDTGGNGLCDLPEVPLLSDTGDIDRAGIEYVDSKGLESKTITEIARMYNIDSSEYAADLAKYLGRGVLVSDLLGELREQEGLCAGIAAEIALSIKGGKTAAAVNAVNETPTEDLERSKFGLITVALLILLFLSFIIFRIIKSAL